MDMKARKKLYILGPVLLILIILIAGTAFLRFNNQNNTPAPFSEEEYAQTKEKIQNIITESDYYKQTGGHNLEYLSKDSDYGQLRCMACDGFVFSFKTEDNKKIKVISGFDKTPAGKISIGYVDAYDPDKKTISYDLLNNEENPLNQPVGPEEKAKP